MKMDIAFGVGVRVLFDSCLALASVLQIQRVLHWYVTDL